MAEQISLLPFFLTSLLLLDSDFHSMGSFSFPDGIVCARAFLILLYE
jgi:hypothetical protein